MEELLIPRHPFDKQHQAQLDLLRSLPEPMRADHARLLRLGNAAFRYQQQAEGEVTEDDFRDWLAGLPEKMRRAVERDGFEKSKSVLGLRRHALERRDLGYDEFVRSLVSAEDWEYDQSLRQASGSESAVPTAGPA